MSAVSAGRRDGDGVMGVTEQVTAILADEGIPIGQRISDALAAIQLGYDDATPENQVLLDEAVMALTGTHPLLGLDEEA